MKRANSAKSTSKNERATIPESTIQGKRSAKQNTLKTKTWYVYILRCADNSYYTGVSANPRRRLEQHNGLAKGGAKYTRSRRPVHFVRQFSHTNKGSALRHERRIKALSRELKARYDGSNYTPNGYFVGAPPLLF